MIAIYIFYLSVFNWVLNPIYHIWSKVKISSDLICQTFIAIYKDTPHCKVPCNNNNNNNDNNDNNDNN